MGRAFEHAAVFLGPTEQVGDGLSDLAVGNVLVRLSTTGSETKRLPLVSKSK